jgi:hypothetical protein
MKTKNLFLLFFVSYLLTSCSILHENNKRNDWKASFKNTVFIASIKSHNQQTGNLEFANDISQAINFDIIGNKFAYNEADSIGKQFYLNIKPSIIQDFNQKKALYNECLFYYTSKELDIIAENSYRKYKKKF